MVRIAALVFVPVALAAKAETSVNGVHVFTSSDGACGTPSTAPAAVNVKMGNCMVHPTGKSIKFGACTATEVTIEQFDDAACATPAGTPSVTATIGTCKAVNEMDLKVASCGKMNCDGADMNDMACEAMPTTVKGNNSSDNAVTASMAGAVVLSAAALVFA